VLNGTQLPVFLDVDLLCEGHLAILGMTRMGKSTLARRLAIELAKTRRVTVLDLTSEWVAKRGLPAYKGAQEDSTPGISVNEPKVGSSTAQFGLQYLQSLVKLAHAEYKVGTPFPRVLIVDEAHQFVPEPAGLGFNSPERDAALQFGQLMMQIRKYRITVALISQRTAVVAKSALSQCENVIAFKSVDQTGLDYLEAVLGGDARRALPSLGVGQALVGGPALNADLTVEAQMLADDLT
jgi:DNA helicase HerA-like ATPase